MSKQSISVKGTMDINSTIAFLEDLVTSFKQKTVCVQRGDEFVTLKPADSIEMEIEATQKKGKQKFSLELSWREQMEEEGEMPFKVSSKEPEVKPVEQEAAQNIAPCDVPPGLAVPAGCEDKPEAKKEENPAAKAEAKPAPKSAAKASAKK